MTQTLDAPVSHAPLDLGEGRFALSSSMPLPGLGGLPVNAFLLDGKAPMLVDAGLPALADATYAALAQVLDPASIEWIWLTHCDPDHLGILERVMEVAPKARIITNYLGMGKLSLRYSFPPTRFFLINPGQSIDVGGRRLQALSMPTYDAPETMGVFEAATKTLWSADCFGALLPPEEALGKVGDAMAIDREALSRGMLTWARIDAPWLGSVERSAFGRDLSRLAELAPELVLSAHLPPARAGVHHLLEVLAGAPAAEPFVGPDQAALEAMLSAA